MSSDLVSEFKKRIEEVNDRVSKAAIRSGRNPGCVKLIVVTKSQTIDVVKAAIQAGAVLLGENYAEEGLRKINELKIDSGVEWHMIGHVQSRKAELVAKNYDYLHSLDGLRLANRLDRSLNDSDKKLPVLLEFNIGDEESKYGWQAADEKKWRTFLPEITQILELQHLKVEGLMTMPPFLRNPELSRPFFKKIHRLQQFLLDQLPGSSWKELSMGTSSDFEIAVEHGATFIRVGQAILGKRL